MAKATKVVHKMKTDPEKEHKKSVQELEELLVDNQEVLKDVFSILEKVRDHEFLNMADSGLSQSDKILTRIVTAVEASDTPKSMKNTLLLFQFLANIDMEDLEPIVVKVNSGILKATEYEKKEQSAGYVGLIRSLKDPQVVEGMNILLEFLKGMGEKQGKKERIQPQNKNFENSIQGMSEVPTESKDTSAPKKSNKRWYLLAAGAWSIVVPLLLKKKKIRS
ncbi:DUF1641 domain-containing protein [Salinicoccus sesuvii]|uniref:DUF1641 domain-containing protein n=1 Tax=Salinicoccus sesuvii TaxID=868281 RepID=A0ABV7N2X0_9STAP